MLRGRWMIAAGTCLALVCFGCGGAIPANDAAQAAPSEVADPGIGETDGGAGASGEGSVSPRAVPAEGSDSSGDTHTHGGQLPPADFLQRIPLAYRVAATYPGLLEGIPCYCPCDLYGHGGLLDCYRSQHAANCSTCLDEALLAGQLYEAQRSRGENNPAAVQAAVKERYRRFAAGNAMQEFPMSQTTQAQAAIQVCSDCHQPVHPAFHSVEQWDESLARMEAYARQGDRMPPEQLWQAAVNYVRSVASRYPPETSQEVRESLRQTVEHLQANEGDSAYYPSFRDTVLDPRWFDRMVAAYDVARELPSELLAETTAEDPLCAPAGHATVLECLESWHAITSERTVEQVEELAASNEGS